MGEEPWAAKIAKALTLEKNKNNLPKTTIQLAELVSRTIPEGFIKTVFILQHGPFRPYASPSTVN